MKTAGVVLAAIGALVPGAASASPPPTLPAPTDQQYRLQPDDFAWLRGGFPDASPAEKARWREVEAWRQACLVRETAAVREELRALGVDPVALPTAPYGDAGCSASGFAGSAVQLPGWEAFRSALVEVRPVFEGFMHAVRLAESTTAARPDAPLAERLRAATVGEQMLRAAMGWGEGGPLAPRLSDDARHLMFVLLGPELERRDRANTAMLPRIVEEQGWPKVSQVGKAAANAAWLLAQHADHDPPFQLRALRLMEPLTATGEVPRPNFAYLYDRVMLKITGKQRYGTQMHCVDGRHSPRPIENPQRLEALRKSMELPTMAEYQSLMEKAYGKSC